MRDAILVGRARAQLVAGHRPPQRRTGWVAAVVCQHSTLCLSASGRAPASARPVCSTHCHLRCSSAPGALSVHHHPLQRRRCDQGSPRLQDLCGARPPTSSQRSDAGQRSRQREVPRPPAVCRTSSMASIFCQKGAVRGVGGERERERDREIEKNEGQ